MVIMFEATNGFHDAANAVATVIYTKSLQPGQAVMLSGLMNFTGVMVGGIAVAYALVELLPAEVLSPPDGGPAIAMLVSLFLAALSWNLGTWWFALPNSSSHCLIGALIGVALGDALLHSRTLERWRALGPAMEGSRGARHLAGVGIRAGRRRYTSYAVNPCMIHISMSRQPRSRRFGGCAAF